MQNDNQREQTSPALPRRTFLLPITMGTPKTLSYSRNFYSISTYDTDHMTLGVELTPSNYMFSTFSLSDEERLPERADVASFSKKNISTTNHDGHTKNTIPPATTTAMADLTTTAMADFWASTYLRPTPTVFHTLNLRFSGKLYTHTTSSTSPSTSFIQIL